MDTVLIFLPDDINGESSGYLYGVYDGGCPKIFYVLGVFDYLNDPQNFSNNLLGSYCGSYGRYCIDLKTENWIFLNCIYKELVVHKVYINEEDYPLEQCHIVQYNANSLVKSELLLSDNQQNESEQDYLQILVSYLRRETNDLKRPPEPNIFFRILITIFQFIINSLNKGYYLTRFTTVGLHLGEHSKNILWLLESVPKNVSLTLQCGNYFTSVLFDMVGGFFVTNLLAKWANEYEVFDWIASNTEDILESINLTIKWLMGSPGGLKLNYPLNYILGNFFLYNIYLWWTFLGLVRPILEVCFFLFLKMGFLGLSFQLALMNDIFLLVTFHLYCIYVYAAKLYQLQVKGIYSLSRIFFGRKKNPEPGKVDSCPYTTEQLFVGTVCFTVLLFLLPTTLVYYIVFTLIRLGAIMIGGILRRARYLLEILPFYSSYVWFLNPKRVATTIQLIPIRGLSTFGSTTLIAETVGGTWLETTQRCTPEVVSEPKPVDWKELGGSILTGKLIYQI